VYVAVRSFDQIVALAPPAAKSTVMLISRPVMSTKDRSACGIPSRQTQTPLIATPSSSGSNVALVVPIAESTRPQFGSSPCRAHLSRLLRDTARPASTASASVAALMTSIRMSLVAPSASAIRARARSAHTDSTAMASSTELGVTPLAPLASKRTLSFVDMQPSESTRSKVRDVAVRRMASSSAASATASVVRTTSIVARPGASMPAPLAMPPTVKPLPSASAVFGTESVVMMAFAALAPPLAERPAVATSIPASNSDIGSRSPIRPVEHTATSIGPHPSTSATFSAER
jgi:hypothetical protein